MATPQHDNRRTRGEIRVDCVCVYVCVYDTKEDFTLQGVSEYLVM